MKILLFLHMLKLSCDFICSTYIENIGIALKITKTLWNFQKLLNNGKLWRHRNGTCITFSLLWFNKAPGIAFYITFYAIIMSRCRIWTTCRKNFFNAFLLCCCLASISSLRDFLWKTSSGTYLLRIKKVLKFLFKFLKYVDEVLESFFLNFINLL